MFESRTSRFLSQVSSRRDNPGPRKRLRPTSTALGCEPLEDRRMLTLHPLTSIPELNSLPGADVSLYLDFDGHYEAQWGGYSDVTTPPYDQDDDLTTFSDEELTDIEEIWAVVAEDFAPFNLNVTTVEPPSFANGDALRVAIGGHPGDWLHENAIGVAYVHSFTNGLPNVVYVFSEISNDTTIIGNVASHEAGHSFGLQHQVVYDENGNATTPIADPGPIMGGSGARKIWWYGTTTGPTVFQDDMAVLAGATNGFGYRDDDHGDTTATASPLVPSGDQLVGTGIIGATTDLDYFSFDTDDARVGITVAVPAGIANLDARVELRDESGQLIASAAPTDSLSATLDVELYAGSYYVVVASEGNYGDVGQYTVTVDPLAPTLTGTVFLDDNRNGTLDEGESGLPGWTLYDDWNENGQYDALLQPTYDSTDTPVTITTGAMTYSYLTVSGLDNPILDINVRVTIDHPNLSVGLVAPDGLPVLLMYVTGADEETQYVDTWFDSDVTTPLQSGTSPYTGTFKPTFPLDLLDGRDPNGVWTLKIGNLDPSEGTLVDWSLEITTEGERTVTTNSQGDYFFAFPDSTPRHIRQMDQPGLVLTAPSGGVYDVANSPGSEISGLNFGNAPPAVLNRTVFYNQSAFDGDDAAINAADDSAIATDKVAYLPGGGLAGPDNLTSYSRGINGIMIDVFGLQGTVTASDFTFRMSGQEVNYNNTPSTWAQAPAPSAVSVRPGAGVDGSDRVEITWADNAIEDRWLEVTVEGNDTVGGFNTNTGLAESDIFYFGNKIGDTFVAGSPGYAMVNATDQIQIRYNSGVALSVTNAYDINRDASVDASDEVIARNNMGFLVAIDIPAAPAAPVAEPGASEDDSASAIASALAAPSADPAPSSPSPQLAAVPQDDSATSPASSLQRNENPAGPDFAQQPTAGDDSDGFAADWQLDDELLDALSVGLLRA